MLYLSTRGYSTKQTFCDILLEGLAPDGGLYLPESYPVVSTLRLEELRHIFHDKGYAALAFEILSLYIDDIPRDDLMQICEKTYTQKIFGNPLVAPLRPLYENIFILALSNGPTLAFKDMAMQLLGNLFEYELARRNQTLNILGATSGDTGSAAEYAMRGKKGVHVFMTSPHGRMSKFQQAQMFSLNEPNIHNIAIEGVFDDCQDLVKQVSNDLGYKRQYNIGTVNSINWARLLAQVVYYFAGYFQATKTSNQKVSFTVPSGNFGNICAGHVARMMGLPIENLIVATNENDVLDEFFRTGIYKARSGKDTFETSSPSMDISKASNFERFIYDLSGRDATLVSQLFADELTKLGQFSLVDHSSFKDAKEKYGFLSGKSLHADRLNTIRNVYQQTGELIDPHTADGIKVATELHHAELPMLVLETALPIKFSKTIHEAVGQEPVCPPAFVALESLPQYVKVLPVDVALLKDYISKSLGSETLQ